MSKATDDLKARVAELEDRAKPPAPPDMKDWRPINPIDRLAMPPSVAAEMAAAVPDHVMRDIVARGGIPSPRGAVPASRVVSPSPARGSGWAHEIPIGPSPHQRYVDQQLDAQDRKDRQLREKEQALLKEAGEKLRRKL